MTSKDGQPAPLKRSRSVIASAWRWLGANDRPLLLIFALIGGLYSFFEYLDHVESDKEQEAARFVQSFGSTEVLRSRINMAVLMNSQEMLDLKQTTYASHVAPMINDEMRFRDISLLIAFFDTLSICVEAGQCSKKTSCDYFFREEEAFIQNMRPALDALSQRNGERVDTHMLKFTRSFCAKNMEEYCRMVVSYRSVDCAALKPKAGSP